MIPNRPGRVLHGCRKDTARYVPLEKVTYPDGREVDYHYNYGTDAAIDEVMSRLASIKDDDDSTVLASYQYLGANRIVTEDYEDIEVDLDYNSDGNLGGLDRFGRVADQVWEDYDASSVLDRYTYTYDRMGNRTARDNELHAAFDEDYTYDALYRLTDTARADAFDQSWDLDGLGNWGSFDDDGTSQDRTVNKANEIQSISGNWITPEYDAAGNMISGPKPGDETTRVHYRYDAWNRLVEVRADDSGEPGALIAEYSYDGLNRRIEKEVTAGAVDTHYFYNTSWQCLEERVEVSGVLPADADVQYVWGDRYIDNLILRDRDTDANGTMDERLYALSDANYNVTTLVDAATGDVVERFLYDAYGTVTELDPDFTPYTGTDYGWEYTYTTRRLDEETGLMYYRNRMYHTELGVFVSRDPIGYAARDPSLYRYVMNAPVNVVDPSGLEPPPSYVFPFGGIVIPGRGWPGEPGYEPPQWIWFPIDPDNLPPIDPNVPIGDPDPIDTIWPPQKCSGFDLIEDLPPFVMPDGPPWWHGLLPPWLNPDWVQHVIDCDEVPIGDCGGWHLGIGRWDNQAPGEGPNDGVGITVRPPDGRITPSPFK